MKDYVFVLILLAGLLFVQSMNIEGLRLQCRADYCDKRENGTCPTTTGSGDPQENVPLVTDANYSSICPEEKSICMNYIYDKHYGQCVTTDDFGLFDCVGQGEGMKCISKVFSKEGGEYKTLSECNTACNKKKEADLKSAQAKARIARQNQRHIAYQCNPGKNAYTSTNWGCTVMTKDQEGEIEDSQSCKPKNPHSCLGKKYFEFIRFGDGGTGETGETGETGAMNKCMDECQVQSQYPDELKECQEGDAGRDVRRGKISPADCIMEMAKKLH